MDLRFQHCSDGRHGQVGAGGAAAERDGDALQGIALEDFNGELCVEDVLQLRRPHYSLSSM